MMTVMELIAALRRYPGNLIVVARSNHAEKPGEIENIASCDSINKHDRSYLIFGTSMYEEKTSDEVIGMLLEQDGNSTIAYDPDGFTFAYDLVECDSVRKVKCKKKKKTFHDIMDHQNFTAEVYEVSWRGRYMLLIQ